jgi:hypothetical protein
MLAIPDATAHVTKLADWLELNAISSPDGQLGFSALVSASDLSKEGQPQDIADDDTHDETLVLSAQAEIRRRRELIGLDYPFRIAENGQSMHIVANVSEIGAAYLLCLFLSHAADRTIVPKKLAPKVTGTVRNFFQACATVAAGGYVQGTAISFGWPRPNKTKFLKALVKVYQQFGDGTPVETPRPAASKDVKDNGIDIIAWRPTEDGLPGTHYLLGQVASGKDWTGKSVVADSMHFHDYWFTVRPSTQHQNAMFMPFCLEPPPTDKSVSHDDVLRDHVQSLGYRYGIVFYRYRIAKFAAEGLRLHRENQHNIEGTEDFPEISKWVKKYRDRLVAG